MSQINTFTKLASHDDLVAEFANQLSDLDLPVSLESAPEVKVAELVNLVVKCANQLEDKNLDTTPADTLLTDLESVLL